MISPLFGVLLLAVVGPPAVPTELIPKTFSELATEADLVARAVVVSTSSAWDASGGVIWTTTTLRVVETWKGTAPKTVSVKEPGGTVHPTLHVVPGMARYRVGEEVVLFTTKDALGQPRTLGCMQGRLSVMRDEEGALRVHGMRNVMAGAFPSTNPPSLSEVKALVTQLTSLRRPR